MSSRGRSIGFGRSRTPHPDRYAALPIVGAGTGMRQGQLFGLEVNGVDFLRHVVHVRAQVRLLGAMPVFVPPWSVRQ